MRWAQFTPLACVLGFMATFVAAEDASAPPDYSKQSLAMLVSVTFLIGMTILFENLEEALMEYIAGSRIVVMVETALGELTVLGFLMFIAFFIEQSGAMDSVSLFLYYTPEGSPYHEENAGKFGEQFEKIHMLLFMVMIIFVLNIIVLCRSAGQIEDKWNEWEMLCHDPERMALFCEDLEAREHDRGGSLRTKTKRLGYTYKTMDEILDYMALRAEFITPRKEMDMSKGGVGTDFDFADYLTCCLTDGLAEIIEVPPHTWFLFWIFALISWVILCLINGNQQIMFCILVGLMMVNLGGIYALRNKLVWIRRQLICSQHVDHGDQGHTWYLGYWFLGCEVRSFEPNQNELKEIRNMERPKPPYLVNQYKNKVTERSWLGQMFLGDELPNAHQALFWMDVEGPEWIQWYERLCLLIMAAYVPIAGGMILDDIKDPNFSTFLVIIKIAAWFLPWYYSFHLILECIEMDEVYNVEMMRNQRMIHKVRGDQLREKALDLMKILNRLRLFSSFETAKEALTPEAMQEALQNMDSNHRHFTQTCFRAFDVDNSGYLESDEIHKFMHTLGAMPTEEKVTMLVTAMDSSKDGRISVDEFMAFMWVMQDDAAAKDMTLETAAEEIFKIFDRDGSGAIKAHELGDTLQELGLGLNTTDRALLMKELDTGSDGEITCKELEKVMEMNGFVP